MKTKALVSVVGILCTFAAAAPVLADTVTAASAGSSNSSGFTTAQFQLASAPGVWIATDYNALASPILVMAEGAGANAYVDVQHQYDAGYAVQEMSRVYVSDSSAAYIANRVWSIVLWANAPQGSGSPADTAIINMGNSVSCVLSTPDQAAIATKALVRHKTVTYKATKTWFWDSSQNKLVQLSTCVLTLNN